MIQLTEIPLPIACQERPRGDLNKAREIGLRIFQAKFDATTYIRVTHSPRGACSDCGHMVMVGVQPGPRTPLQDHPPDDAIVEAALAALRLRIDLPPLQEIDRCLLRHPARAFASEASSLVAANPDPTQRVRVAE